MKDNRRQTRLGIFTRPIDQGTSGNDHHLLEMIRRVLERNTRFEIFLIHYERNDREIYRHAPEIVIPRNPVRASGPGRWLPSTEPSRP